MGGHGFKKPFLVDIASKILIAITKKLLYTLYSAEELIHELQGITVRETVIDKYGNEIYLTDERWRHIVRQHAEMLNYRQHLLKTLRDGKRKQHHLELDVFVYTKRFSDLKPGMSHVVVIVKFGFKSKGAVGIHNNFVLTSYQKRFPHKK